MELFCEIACPKLGFKPASCKTGMGIHTPVWVTVGLLLGRSLARCLQRPTIIASTALFWFQTLALYVLLLINKQGRSFGPARVLLIPFTYAPCYVMTNNTGYSLKLGTKYMVLCYDMANQIINGASV